MALPLPLRALDGLFKAARRLIVWVAVLAGPLVNKGLPKRPLPMPVVRHTSPVGSPLPLRASPPVPHTVRPVPPVAAPWLPSPLMPQPPKEAVVVPVDGVRRECRNPPARPGRRPPVPSRPTPALAVRHRRRPTCKILPSPSK